MTMDINSESPDTPKSEEVSPVDQSLTLDGTEQPPAMQNNSTSTDLGPGRVTLYRFGPGPNDFELRAVPRALNIQPTLFPTNLNRDPLIGKTVKVRKGVTKGFVGVVRDTTDDMAIIDLSTKNKKITVHRDKLVIIDPESGEIIEEVKIREKAKQSS